MTTVMPVLVRREFWEHRALWIAPLVVAGLILLGAIVADLHLRGGPGALAALAHGDVMFVTTVWLITMPQFFVMMIVLFLYAIDCLYTERKDRSILFWKSMPVSDTQTVLSKLLITLVVVPVGVYLVSLVTLMLSSIIWTVRFSGSPLDITNWNFGLLLQVQGFILLGLLASILWYSPIVAYLLLVSAWARRNVFLWVALPPLLLIIIENMIGGTSFVANFLGYRFGDVWQLMSAGNAFAAFEAGGPDLMRAVFDAINAAPILSNIDLWLGVVVAAVFVYAAIRIRQYRDDT